MMTTTMTTTKTQLNSQMKKYNPGSAIVPKLLVAHKHTQPYEHTIKKMREWGRRSAFLIFA
jgi:hypothetical protein